MVGQRRMRLLRELTAIGLEAQSLAEALPRLRQILERLHSMCRFRFSTVSTRTIAPHGSSRSPGWYPTEQLARWS